MAEPGESLTYLTRVIGKLHCEYYPGVMLALRDGKIICFGGSHNSREFEENPLQAKDGKSYENCHGMVELFDPSTGISEVLTQMPFDFGSEGGGDPARCPAQAVELEDGRIFILGLFQGNGSKSLARTRNSCLLPVFSADRWKQQLLSIAPPAAPHLFGFLFDRTKNNFDVVNCSGDIYPRALATLHVLDDGRVLILGGTISGTAIFTSYPKFPETRVLAFDPRTRRISVVGSLTNTRFWHRSLQISKDKFLLFDGIGAANAESRRLLPAGSTDWLLDRRTQEVELFDLSTGRSTIVGKTLLGRFDFGLIKLSDEKLLLTGGALHNNIGHHCAELYDYRTNKCAYVGRMLSPSERARHLIQPPVLFAGESVLEQSCSNDKLVLISDPERVIVYSKNDLAAGASNFIASPPATPRFGHTAVAVPHGRLLLLGGRTFRAITGATVTVPKPALTVEELQPRLLPTDKTYSQDSAR